MTPLCCEDVEPLLPLIADGALDQRAEPAAFAHLADCPHCQEQLALHDLVGVALTASAPASALRPRPRLLRFSLPWAIASAACLAALVAAGWAVHSNRPLSADDRRLARTDEPRPDTEVITVPGSRPGTVMYVIRRGDQVVVVDPQQSPHTVRENPAEDVPVGLRRY